MKRVVSTLLALTMSASLLAGCQTKKEDNGKINLTVGGWVSETIPDEYQRVEKLRQDFMEKNPDINIIPDKYTFDTQTFAMKANGKQLPNVVGVYFTEIENIMQQGYARDITDVVKKWGYDKDWNPELLELVSDDNGKIYGLPNSVYKLGLAINKSVFKKAGLVNADGSIKCPDSWADVAEFSKIIKEKTGNAGISFPTTNNCGGWQFLNIAWGYGADFVKLEGDGKWTSTIDTPEMEKALQYISDLKWKQNGLLTDNVVDLANARKYFAIGQAGMLICDPSSFGEFDSVYGMNKDDLMIVKMPRGDAGRYAQMGGGVNIFSNETTDEQIDAALKWMEFADSYTPNLTDDRIAHLEELYDKTVKDNGVVLPREGMYVWVNPEYKEKMDTVMQKYTNLDYNDLKDYYESNDVTIKPEPGACAQQLYAVMDKCIQEVITNKNADISQLLKTASNDYQKNHLDKMN